MSTGGRHIPNDGAAGLVRNARGEETGLAAQPSPAAPPYLLLWFTGIVAFALATAAFVLWGINGAGTLFDMMVALCT